VLYRYYVRMPDITMRPYVGNSTSDADGLRDQS
jgi:hypothetical protein